MATIKKNLFAPIAVVADVVVVVAAAVAALTLVDM